jgi:hypothetical protein
MPNWTPGAKFSSSGPFDALRIRERHAGQGIFPVPWTNRPTRPTMTVWIRYGVDGGRD